MDPEAGAPSQRRAFPRVPLRAKARMEFAEQRCFLSEWAVNLSPGGMFVRSEAPMAAGQRFHFEASLTPKGPRFEGIGEVTWVRREWEGNARPPGFAVRFLELQSEGRDTMVRLADIFLDEGVAAMQDELQAMSAAWQRRRLDDETTDELHPVEEPDEPLPDTAVLHAPWAIAAAGSEEETASLAQVDVAPIVAVPEPDGAAPPDPDRQVTAAMAIDAALDRPPAAAPPAASGRRRAWWVGALALLLGGGGYLLLRGPLAGGVDGVPAEAGGAEALPMAPPRAVAASARSVAGPAAFGGLEGVSWTPEGDGLWVVLALDGAIPAGALHRIRLDQDPPREVIQLSGARHGYNPAVMLVHSPLLEQIRVGFHPGATADPGASPGLREAAADELRVVLDLPSSAVVVRSVLTDGRSLRLLLVRDPAAAAAGPTGSVPLAAAARAVPVRSTPAALDTGNGAPAPAAPGPRAAPPPASPSMPPQ